MMSKPSSNALGKASTSAHSAVDSIAGAAHQAVDRAADATAPTADWLSEQGDSLKATQKKLVADSCDYVSANPLKSIGFAVVAGFLLSRIFR